METERLILCPFEETEGGYYEVKQEDVQNQTILHGIRNR